MKRLYPILNSFSYKILNVEVYLYVIITYIMSRMVLTSKCRKRDQIQKLSVVQFFATHSSSISLQVTSHVFMNNILASTVCTAPCIPLSLIAFASEYCIRSVLQSPFSPLLHLVFKSFSSHQFFKTI